MSGDPLVAGDDLVLFRTGENAGSAERPYVQSPAFGLVVNSYDGGDVRRGDVYDTLPASERRRVNHRRAARLLHGVAPALEPGRYVAATFELLPESALRLFRGSSGLCLLCDKGCGDAGGGGGRNAHVLVQVRHMNDWMRFRSPSVDGREGPIALKVIWSAGGAPPCDMPYLPLKEDVVYLSGPSYTAGTHLLGKEALTELVNMPNGRTHLLVSVKRRMGSSFVPNGSEEALLKDVASLIESCGKEDAVLVALLVEATNTARAYEAHLETAARSHGDALIAKGWGSLAEDARHRLKGLFDVDDEVMGNVQLIGDDGGSVAFPLSVLSYKSRHWWERLRRGDVEPEGPIWIPTRADVTRWAVEMAVFGSLTDGGPESSRSAWDDLTLSESDSLAVSALAGLAGSWGMDALVSDYVEAYFLNNVRAETAERAVQVALSMGRSSSAARAVETRDGGSPSEWPTGDVVEALVPYALHGAFLRKEPTTAVHSRWSSRRAASTDELGSGPSFGYLILRTQAELFGHDATPNQAEGGEVDDGLRGSAIVPGRPIDTEVEYRAELEKMERQMDSFWMGKERPSLLHRNQQTAPSNR
jgi:hypothetical protein